MVQKRPSGYYFRWVMPYQIRSILDQTELVKSLKTHDKSLAYARAERLFRMVFNLKQSLEGFRVGQITQEQFEAIVAGIWEKANSSVIFPAYSGHHADTRLKQAQENLEDISHVYRGTQPKRGLRPSLFSEYQNKAMIKLGMEFNNSPDEHELNVIGWVGTQEEFNFADRLAVEMVEAEKHYNQRIVESLSPIGNTQFNHQVESEIKAKSGVTLEMAFEQFIEHKTKEGLTDKAEKEHRSNFECILYLMENKDLLDYSRKSFIRYYQDALSIPLKNRNPYKGKSFEQIFKIYSIDDIPPEHTISKKTIDGHRKLIQGIFKFARDEEIILSNPDLGIPYNIKSDDRRYASYSDREVQSLLGGLEKGTHRYWITHIACYGGMRSNEICQLVNSDIRLDEETQSHYIFVNNDGTKRVKTDAAIRKVPIHRRLIELGFLNYVKKSGDQLFEGTDSKSITRWFRGYREQMSVPAASERGNRKVFHSFRHTFTSKAASKNITKERIAAVVGHDSKKTITDNYIHFDTLKSLLEVVDVIDFGEGF